MDEHEVLDWGNEEEDLKFQGSSRNLAYDNQGDVDDAEDAVSLGEDDDEREYAIPQPGEGTSGVGAVGGNTFRASVATDHFTEQETWSSSSPQNGGPPTAHAQPSSAKSPSKNGNSNAHHSPHRPRLTHALPPKPVATAVPFLHPSHPSIVEATAMSVSVVTRSGRSTAKSELEPLPPYWETRQARSGQGETYYYNTRTQKSTWTRPVSSSSSPSRSDSTRRRQGSISLPAASKPLSPTRSNQAYTQSQDSDRHWRAQPPPDSDLTDPPQLAVTPNVGDLSYEDRHYRPGGSGSTPFVSANRRGDRSRVADVDPRFNPRPDVAFTPTPSPPSRAREPARPPSPMSLVPTGDSRSRDARSSHVSRSIHSGRNLNTDADTSTQRDHSVLQLSDTSLPNEWNQVDNKGRRGVHHDHRVNETLHEESDELPLLPGSGSLRSRIYDQDQHQARERRDEDLSQNMSAPRTRSPSYNRDTRVHYDEHNTRHQPRELDQHEPAPLKTSRSSPALVPQRKHERHTRFGPPPSALLSTSLSAPDTRPSESYSNRRVDTDDPFVPDDIRLPPQDIQAHHGSGDVRDQPSIDNAPQQVNPSENEDLVLPHYPGKTIRPIEDHNTYPDRGRSQPHTEQATISPTFEQPARRSRAPLPPQKAEFLGIASRSREERGRPPPRARRGEDQQRPSARANGNNYSQRSHPQSHPLGWGNDESQRSLISASIRHSERDTRPRDKRPLAIYPPSPGGNEPASGMSVSGFELPPHPSATRPSLVSAHAQAEADLGMYSDEEADVSRGLQAKPTTVTKSRAQPPLSSPLYNHGLPAESRSFERSPPPRVAGRTPEGTQEYDPLPAGLGTTAERGSERLDERTNYSSEKERRELRDQQPSGPNSGTNNVPIRSIRRNVGNDGRPRGFSPPARTPNDGSYETGSANPRSGGMRGHGTHREIYGRAQAQIYESENIYQPGRPDGDTFSRRDGSPPPYEAAQPINIKTAPAHDSDIFSNTSQRGYDPEPARLPSRTWTPRGVTPPHDTFQASTSVGSDGRLPTPPPLSREPSQHVSPSWEPGEMPPPPTRLAPSRTLGRSGSSRDASTYNELRFQEAQPPQLHDDQSRAQSRGQDGYFRANSLERRLGDHYEPPPVVARQPHALPPNPTLYRDHPMPAELDKRYSDRRPMRYGNAEWEDPPRDAPQPRSRDTYIPPEDQTSRRSRKRRQGSSYVPGEGQEVGMNLDDDPRYITHQERDSYPQRRRGGSLLDRMSLDHNEPGAQGEMPPQSLRERVQEVPLKRDRGEMLADDYDGGRFEEDGLDPALKKARRRGSTRPRRGRRGP